MKSKLLLLGLSMGLSLDVTAGDVLATKEGPFEKFNRCFVADGKTELQIGSSFSSGHRLSETASLYTSTEEIKALSASAIAGIGRHYFRWFPTQTDYRVRGADGKLVTYFSDGFRNINNDSEAALEIQAQVDQICDQRSDFKILGEFQVDLKIGNKVFADTLKIERSIRPFSNASVSGTYTVPDSFESKIKNLIYKDGIYSFEIHVKEATQEYDAIFEGTIDRKGQLAGKAFILPNRDLLGTFTGKRL